jgi:hypothetical protein
VADSPSRSEFTAENGYKELIGLLKAEETLFWSRNQTFLMINAGLVAVVGLTFPKGLATAGAVNALLAIAACLVGAGMSALWFLVACRSQAFYDHWYEQLKYYEQQRLTGVEIFQMADSYFDGEKITLGGKDFQLTGWSKRLRIFKASQMTAVLLLLIWVILLGSIFIQAVWLQHSGHATVVPG